MDIVGLEPRRSDLARGILIARSARPLDASAQDALWAALATAGVTERTEEETEDHANDPDRQFHAAPWLPPAAEELAAHRAAVEAACEKFELEKVWFVKVETGADGVAWLELEAESRAEAIDDDDDDDDELDGGDPDELAGAVIVPIGADEQPPTEEVLYAAPDAPPEPSLPIIPEADDDDADDLDDGDDLDSIQLESHWRNGAPPFEHSVSFPIERYPEIIDDYDWESFGIAVKLAGSATLGEESVINAFFALWLSVYQDERAEDFEPFQRADVIHDRRHRSALMWVERFAVPATAADQVHFLLWIAARLDEIVPLAWARFDSVDDTMKARANGDDGEPPFVLAGNPFADRFRRQGEEAALAWAVSQSSWSRRELAGMLVEVALEHDPDDPKAALVAERLLRRAQSFEPGSDAAGYLAIVLVRQHRLPEAIQLAEAAPSRDVRLLVIGEIAEHAPADLGPALALLDDATARETPPEDLAELVASIARHASGSGPGHLAAVLAKLPADVHLVPHLYNASFSVDRPQALAILRRVIGLPEPAKAAGEARTALVMAWNNACIHAHALGDYRLAVELADGGQRFAAENPYIYHSAACAYAAVGQIDRAIAQVALAIEHDYEHAEKMETDADLAPLASDPRFGALFTEWRGKRADLN
jgi:tetratricopeptide (TPR) repeat protein